MCAQHLVHPGALPVLDRKIAMSNQSTYASHSGHGKKPDCIDASPMVTQVPIQRKTVCIQKMAIQLR